MSRGLSCLDGGGREVEAVGLVRGGLWDGDGRWGERGRYALCVWYVAEVEVPHYSGFALIRESIVNGGGVKYRWA